MQARMKRFLLVLVSAIGVVAYAALLWRGPWWFDGAHLRTEDLQPADGVVITGFRTMLVAIGAGLIAAIGLYYTHRAHQQTRELFDHTRAKDREQADLTREGQVTERYVEAIKLLSTESLTQQLGGIYALERIMLDSEKDRRTVIEVLAAFIREAPKSAVSYVDGAGEERRPRQAAIQAALVALSRRPDPEVGFNLEGAELDGLNAVHLNLRGVSFYGASLQRMSAQGADLRRAYFGDANLTGTSLYSANLEGAIFRDADMTQVNLRGAAVAGVDWRRANLAHTNLGGTIGLDKKALRKAKLADTTVLPSGEEEG